MQTKYRSHPPSSHDTTLEKLMGSHKAGFTTSTVYHSNSLLIQSTIHEVEFHLEMAVTNRTLQ